MTVLRTALLYLVDGCMPKPLPAEGSDRQGKLVERDRHAPSHRLLDRELVVASSQILHEAMPGNHDPRAAVLLEPAHGTQPRLQPAVICFETVVAIPIGAMPSRG